MPAKVQSIKGLLDIRPETGTIFRLSIFLYLYACRAGRASCGVFMLRLAADGEGEGRPGRSFALDSTGHVIVGTAICPENSERDRPALHSTPTPTRVSDVKSLTL